jgi:hypothetical protein
MSLNNLHSKTIKENLGKGYVNISSWGQNIKEDYCLLKIFGNYYNAKTVLISSNYIDFNNTSKKIKYHLLMDYLNKKRRCICDIMDAKYLLKESKSYHRNKSGRNIYTSLQYDGCGGVNFQDKDFNIDPIRWKGNSIEGFNIDPLQYNYLDSISNYCKANGINLFFIQSPYRNGYYSKLNKTELGILHSHKCKIDSILKTNDQLFIDAQNEIWSDSLFVDYSHFSMNGAKKYTQYFTRTIGCAELRFTPVHLKPKRKR